MARFFLASYKLPMDHCAFIVNRRRDRRSGPATRWPRARSSDDARDAPVAGDESAKLGEDAGLQAELLGRGFAETRLDRDVDLVR